ncbi:hypothetical protein G3545_08630 [Starkeya sp. ORNL1]|uniref:hypothetical protein n=1 Tax=Starkeya sp. ORNL1 TaxID=2709380 RepID=UPI001462D574|nr:hypothetical protein [Starkeya sp. ORNL1]QJP13718.1 hypothetical protein G3545_08630 [Starkeya sp. ORNL1]
MGEHLPERWPRDQMDDAFVDSIVESEGHGDWREAIRNLVDRVWGLHEEILRLTRGEPRGGRQSSHLDRMVSTIDHSVICTECSHCLHRTAQPPAMVRSFYKNREVTLREWAASQRCRCGQLGVDVVLRDTRDAKNWMLQR